MRAYTCMYDVFFFFWKLSYMHARVHIFNTNLFSLLFGLRTYETSLLVEESISDELPYSGKYIWGNILPLLY